MARSRCWSGLDSRKGPESAWFIILGGFRLLTSRNSFPFISAKSLCYWVCAVWEPTCIPEAYVCPTEEEDYPRQPTSLHGSILSLSLPKDFPPSINFFSPRSSVSFFIGSVTKVYKHYFFSVLKKINPCNSYPLIIITHSLPLLHSKTSK